MRLQNADNCVYKEPKYRSLDGEATECRLCKHCGCMLIIGANAASPTLVVNTENCLYVWYIRIPYIYILSHLCVMQYFYIAYWFM